MNNFPDTDVLAHQLDTARKQHRPIAQISRSTPLDSNAAYTIQEKQLKLRLADGEKQTGWKMGLTSEAKRRQMNLDSPLYGFLTNRMQIANGGHYAIKNAIHPKIEPEIAFLFRHPLEGKVDRKTVLAACEGVAACMEILDSRYEQFQYFSLEDVIADNASSSHFVVGTWQKADGLDLRALEMRMLVNGDVVQKGVSESISGDPALSVIQLCELLARRHRRLEAGQIVLAGAATAAVALSPGMRVELQVTGLASVSVGVE